MDPDDEREDGEGDPRAQVGHVRLHGHQHGQAQRRQPLRRHRRRRSLRVPPPLLKEGRSPNGVVGMSWNGRNISFLEFFLDKTVAGG